MADKKISQLPTATTPLAGTEVLPIVQSGTTDQVSVANLTAGRAVSAASLTLTSPLTIASGGTNQTSYTSPASNIAGLVWFDGTSFQNDTTTSRVGYNASTNVFYANTPTFAGNTTLSTGNLVIGTSGKGIDFSATASGSGTMTSELLDDYEEGLFTPSYEFSGGGGTITYAQQHGTYRKIGRMVYCTIWIETSSATLGTGTMRIDGLPYALHINAIYRNGCGSIGYATGWVTLAPQETYMIEGLALLFLCNIVATTTTDLPAANFNTGSGNILFMSFCYPTIS